MSGDAVLDVDAKTVATLVARAAIAGYQLVQLADGSFVASRWGMFRSLDHAAAVEAFLARVGAGAGHEPDRLERERRSMIDAANRAQDRLDEAADFLRGPGGSSP